MIARPDLARRIVETGIFEFKPRQLTDGSESKYYLNFRKPPKGKLTDGLISELGARLWQIGEREKLTYFGVVGVPNAGIPFAQAVSRYARVPIYELWKQGEGAKRAIVAPPGFRFPHGPVLPCDDVVTKGLSKLEAVRAIREAGGIIRDMVVLVDREQGGREALAREAVRLRAVWRISELLTFWRDEQLVSHKRYEEIATHLAAHEGGE